MSGGLLSAFGDATLFNTAISDAMISAGAFIGRSAQVRPIDVGAQILASHHSIGSALNGYAALNWYLSEHPLTDSARSNAH